MRKVIVLEHISLDGVIQAPGVPDEDTSGGFAVKASERNRMARISCDIAIEYTFPAVTTPAVLVQPPSY